MATGRTVRSPLAEAARKVKEIEQTNGTSMPTTASYIDDSGNKQTGYVAPRSANTTQTTYKDALGQQQTGYIIDGTTYKDAAGTQRIDTGSVVNTAGGEYILTPEGSMLYSDYLAQQGNPGNQGNQGGNYGSGTTTYIDPNGQTQTGYIINGVTYADAAGTQRIGTGSIVPTAGGSYILTPEGSVLYSDYLAQQQQQMQQPQIDTTIYDEMLANAKAQYAAQLAANDQAAAAQTQQAIARLEAQKSQLNTSYDDLNRQLYIDRRQSELTIPQQLAAMGYTGGLTESSMLGLRTSYEEALRANEQGRYSGIQGIELGMTEAEMEIAIARAQAEQQLSSQYSTSYANILAMMQDQQNYAQEQANSQMNYQNALNLQKAETLAALGDFSGYLAIGYSPEQVVAMGNAYKAQNAPATVSYSSGNSGGSTPKSQPMSASNLSTAAKNILNAAAKSYSSASGVAQLVGNAYKAGSISEAEANFILDAIGA